MAISTIKRDAFNYAGTQVEPVTADTEVQCEIIHISSCSTPLCSPVKSVGCNSDDDNKDLDYVPLIYFPPKTWRKRGRRRRKKGRKTEENQRYKEVLSQLTFFKL